VLASFLLAGERMRGHCQRKILNTRGGHGTPWINLEKSREINGGEIRSRRAGKVFDFSLTMPCIEFPLLVRHRPFAGPVMVSWRMDLKVAVVKMCSLVHSTTIPSD